MSLYRVTLALVVMSLSLTGCSEATDAPAKESVVSGAAAPAAVAAAPDKPVFDWPNWRGPRHDGISREPFDATGWSQQPPKKLWAVNVGTGFSSVSVRGGRLFTMGHRGGNDTIYCLDAASGSELWKHSYACELVDNLHEGGPAATPTIDDNRVYTVSKQGHVFCLAADSGQVVWKLQLSETLGVGMPEWGFSCSPLVLDGQLVIAAGRTVSFNKLTGKLLWQSDKFRPGYGSPVAFEHGGRMLVAVLNNDCLLVVGADDGTMIAQYPWQSDFTTSSTTPIVSGDTIFISTGYNRGCALVKLAGGRLTPVYENRNMSNHMNNCVLWESCLYGFDGNSHSSRTVKLSCLDHATGALKWQQRGLGCGSLFIADGKLVVLSDEGELAVATAQPSEYREIARLKVLSGRCWTAPVLSNGRIYCRNARGDLVCVGGS